MLFLYALVIICLIQESANGTALVGASRSKPNATTSNGFTAHPFLLASEIAFTYTLSSLGIFGFLIFGTSHALRKTWWKCLFSDTEYDNNNTTHYVGPTYSIAGSHRNSSDSSSASSMGSSILWGFYLQTSSGYKLSEDWALELSLRYDHTEELNGRVGNSSFDVDLGGLSLGLGANYSF